MLIINKREEYNIIKQIFSFIGFFLPIIIFPFSPFFSFIISMMVLLSTSIYKGKLMRIFFSILAYLSLAFIYASRLYKEELAMDLYIYFDIFEKISQGYFWQVLFFFGRGIEGGLVILYKIYYDLFGFITPYHLAFFNMIICGLGSIFWLEKYGMRDIPYKYRGYCSFFFILFFTIQMTGFLQRQAIATTILLFALSQSKKRNFYILLLLGTFFHLTTLPLGLFFRYLIWNEFSKNKTIKIIISIIIFRILFYVFITIFIKLGIPGSEKLVHFMEADFAIASGRFLLLILFLLLLLIFNFKKLNNNYKNYLLISSIFYLIFLGVPLFSERVFFILLYLYGFYFFITTYKHYLKSSLLFSFLYFILFSLEKANLLRTLYDEFWQRYPMFSLDPFYYLI